MARNQSMLVNWSQYTALRAATGAMHCLPVNTVMKGARDLGSLMYRFDRKHRLRGIGNISRSMPELPEAQVARIAERSMQHFLELGVEVLFTTRLINIDTWASRIRLHQLEEALDLLLSPRPVIMLTGHFGNWELLGYLLATFGIRSEAIARPIDNPLVNEWLTGVRERRGLKLITKWGATDRMTRIMEANGTLGFIADQNAGEKGLFVPFFGRLASTYKSIGLLAMTYNAPVICGYARRLGDAFQYEMGTTDIIYPEDWKQAHDPLYYLTARYMRAIEAMVRLSPEQYLWIHRRWKSRPRHERLGKAMPSGLEHQLRTLPWMTDDELDRLKQVDAA
jgi:KDO2-lipid IV(A) lauroyltransferase